MVAAALAISALLGLIPVVTPALAPSSSPPASSPAGSARCWASAAACSSCPFLNLVLGLPVHGRGGHQPDDGDRHVELGVGGARRQAADQYATRHAARGGHGGGQPLGGVTAQFARAVDDAAPVRRGDGDRRADHADAAAAPQRHPRSGQSIPARSAGGFTKRRAAAS